VFVVGVQMFITGPESLGMASFPTSGVVVGSTVFNDATSLAMNGWGIPTATDIALAWLIARLVFGTRSAAVSFLLLLAVADDAIGLGIIAVFYPSAPPEPMWMLLILAGMGAAYGMRKKNVQTWVPYVVIGGTLSWFGFYLTNLHPALALVPIIPFLPGPVHDTGLFAEEDEVDRVEHGESFDDDLPAHHQHTPLHNFEHHLKLPVDFGLFFFAWANAGVQITGELGVMTWLVLAALIIGKTLGVTLFSYGATFLGFPLPDGLRLKHLVVVGIIAGLGLTVALFVSGEAFKGQGALLDDAKMGSLLSFVAAFLAMGVGAILRVKTDYKVAKAEKSLPDSRHFTAESSRRFPERPLAKPEKKS
jgi:NhaA family Na+:H+ antiporter